jgi:hypothetical protein
MGRRDVTTRAPEEGPGDGSGRYETARDFR